jgi:hypothetical protein
MRTQRSRSFQLTVVVFAAAAGIFAFLDGRAATAEDIQGIFTCALDGESSQIELALASARQQVPVRGRLEVTIKGSDVEVSKLAFSTDPIPFSGRETALEFALDPATPAVAAIPPFISHFLVPATLLVSTDSATPPTRVEASFQVDDVSETLTGLLSGVLPGDRNSSSRLRFILPVSCTRGIDQNATAFSPLACKMAVRANDFSPVQLSSFDEACRGTAPIEVSDCSDCATKWAGCFFQHCVGVGGGGDEIGAFLRGRQAGCLLDLDVILNCSLAYDYCVHRCNKSPQLLTPSTEP